MLQVYNTLDIIRHYIDNHQDSSELRVEPVNFPSLGGDRTERCNINISCLVQPGVECGVWSAVAGWGEVSCSSSQHKTILAVVMGDTTTS